MLRRATMLLGAVLLVAGCGSSSDSSSATDAAAEPVTSEARAEFCDVWETMQDEVPESYIGSDEHVADIQELLDVSPPEISTLVTTFRDFLASGAVDSEADPDSNLIDNWPIAVQDAITDVQIYATGVCPD